MKRLDIIGYSLALALLGFHCSARATAQTLTSETIASRAEQVARETRSTGRCYAAIARALKPLSVNLYGESAHQAKDLLLKDTRFVPLVVTDIDELSRGDIIVYQKSQSRPHGHISVYQGQYTEASDHISAVTHTHEYGGATVFRLRDVIAEGPIPHPAPASFLYQPAQPQFVPQPDYLSADTDSYQPPQPQIRRASRSNSLARSLGVNKQAIGRALIRAGLRYLLRG